MKPNKSQLAEVPPALQKRKARIQPHAAIGVAVSCLAAGAFVAYAATGGQFSFPKSSSVKSPVPMKSKRAAKTIERGSSKAQLLGNTGGAKKGGFLLTQATSGGGRIGTRSLIGSGIGSGTTGNNLTEVDLTSKTASDERDASFSPNGEYIAFRSNGIDANNDGKLDANGFSADGKYHIWVGKFQSEVETGGAPTLSVYQVTGKNALYLSGFDQYRPSWSTNSRELIFVSNSSINGGQSSGEQIYRIDLNLQTSGVPQPAQPYNLTHFPGQKKSPTWSLNGTEIVFSAKTTALGGTGTSFDLFRISSNGDSTLFTRVTGGESGDVADDTNPAFSLIQQNAVFFSSNRSAGAGRRIYVVRTDGTGLTQVTDPASRPNGSITDDDDMPALSLAGAGGNGNGELLAFQSNSLIDGSDSYKDRNIWSLEIDSRLVGVVPPTLTPRFYISAENDRVLFVNPPNGSAEASKINVESGANVIPGPQGVVYYQDSNGSYVYVSSRNRNRVERLDAVTGEARPAVGLSNSAFTPNDPVVIPPATQQPTGEQVPSPRGLAISGNYLYVVSGTDLTNAVYRYTVSNGTPQPGTGLAGARFTYGEPATKPLGSTGETDVSEGVTLSPDGTRLYVSNYAKDRINVYTTVRFTSPINGPFNPTPTPNPAPTPNPVPTSKTYQPGQWLGEITAPQATSNVLDPDGQVTGQKADLKAPTGLAIGPSINDDTIPDLYVASSGTNDVLAFALNSSGATIPLADGSQFKIVVRDNDFGSLTQLRSPKGIRFDAVGNLYVASYGDGAGQSINRYKKSGDGSAAIWTAAGVDTQATNAAWIRFPNATDMPGPSYFDFNPTFSNNFIDINQSAAVTQTFKGEEAGNVAQVVTNILSSQNNLNSSDLNRIVYDSNGVPATVNISEDKSADIEPSFGRSDSLGATIQSRVQVVFSSNRKFAPSPSSNYAGATPSNPGGGDDSQIPAESSTGATPKPVAPANCDLWITAASDIEAPVIQPEQNNYPMLSPTHDSGNFSSNPDIGPRTPRGGLTPGSSVKLALLAKEKQSGLASVSFAFYNAEDARRFSTDASGHPINENLYGITRREVAPSAWPAVGGFDFDDPGMQLNLVDPDTKEIIPSTATNYYSDQGPRGANRERQANAVAGDGIYYLAKTITAPNTPGDYYISIRLIDRSGNSSYYYFVWGFSTSNFTPSTTNDIFVSDNTAGQQTNITGRGGSRSSLKLPVESFYLNNWGSAVNSDVPYIAGTVIDGKSIATSNPVTFDNVDVWRVLCRGPIDEDIVSTNYIPSTVTQINPDKFTNGFQVKDKVFANVQRVVLWAAPYAGTSEVEFDIPGSIKEGATKEQLKRLLAGGGRLFLTGRNVLTALDEGGADNSFRSQELFAVAAGKTVIRDGIAVAPTSGTNAFPELDYSILPPGPRPQYSGPQFPWNPGNPLTTPDYRDASYSHSSTTVGTADSYTPQTGANVQVFQAYQSDSGKPIGQRIVKKRSTDINSGLESRTVFFSFNFDGVNRRYTRINNVPVALNVRKDIADGIRVWFKTGTFSGRVLDNTGATVANALVAVQAGTDLYYARTDATGFYELKGLPAGRIYSAFFVFNDKTFAPDTNDNDNDDRDDLPADDVNRNYFTATGSSDYLDAGATSTGNDIRVQKVSPGSVTGKLYTYAGSGVNDNPLDRTLHSPISGIQVLLTLATPNTTSQAQVYTRLARTTATGDFTFADAPAGRKLLLILNPKPTDVPTNSDLTNPNTPGETTVAYKPEYGRRVIPIDNDNRRKGDVIAIQNDVFVVNDTYVYNSALTDLSTYPTPATDTAADEKDANGNSLPVVLTRGEPISGKFSLVAGVDTPVVAAGWQVQLIPVNGANNGATRTTVTKADGTYSFDEVLNGTYDIIGTVPPSAVNGYTPFTVQLSNVDTTALSDVQKAAQDLTAKISHIAGAVRVNGSYVSGATVTLQDTNGTPIVYGTPPIPRKGTSGNRSGNANYFIGYVPAGSYLLVAQLPNNAADAIVRPITIDANTTVKVEDFDFSISSVKVKVVTSYAGISAAGIDVTATSTSGGPTKTATTDANGFATFLGLAGDYTLKASKTVFGVTAEDTSSSFNVISTSDITVPDLNLKWDSLSGVVKLNNVPKSGAKVQFLLNGTLLPDLTATTAGNGKYEAGKNAGSSIARPLAAGTYTVRASIVSNGLTLSSEKSVTINSPFSGNIISVPDFNFKNSYVTGLVTFNGQPAVDFQVKLYKADGVTPFTDSDGVDRVAQTDSTGRYRLYSVPVSATNYVVTATKQFGTSPVTGSATISDIDDVTGITNAPTINIAAPAGLSGQVRVNLEGAPGAVLEVLNSKKKSLSPAVIVTADANGRFFITAPTSTSTSSVTYYLKASYSEGGRALTPIAKSFKVKSNVYTPATLNFDFKATRIKGHVTANTHDAVGATITLLDSKGKALKQPRTAVTDDNGNYVLSGVSSGTFMVQASLGGSTASKTVKVSSLKTYVVDLALSPQELVVTTEFRVGSSTTKIGDAPGATVEILSSTGNSLGSSFVKVTDADSHASFFGLAAGSYRARVTLQGYSTTTVFSVGVGASARTAPIILSQVTDLLLLSESNNMRTTELGGIDILRASLLVKPTQDVQVTLTASTPAEATFSSGNTVVLTFSADNWSTEQAVTVVGQQDNVADGDEAFNIAGTVSTGDSLYSQIPNFTLSGTNFESATIPSTGPTFPANSKNLVSTPFTHLDGTLTVAEAFGNSGYTLYRFNSAGQQNRFLGGGNTLGVDWIPMSGSDNMERGRGYLLVTGSSPVTMLVPANPTIFAGDSFEVEVVRNPNFEAQTGNGNINNGYDIIGFPFDPSTVSGVDILQQAQVLADGVLYPSFLEAAGAGKISNRIYGIDSLGRPVEITPANSSVKAYKGYFVKIFTNSVKIIMNATPSSGSSNSSSSVQTSSVKTSSIKKS